MKKFFLWTALALSMSMFSACNDDDDDDNKILDPQGWYLWLGRINSRQS